MKNFFKPSDFPQPRNSNLIDVVSAADIANAKLAKEIERWPVVFGENDIKLSSSLWLLTKTPDSNRVARLAFIEELPERECVKHEPDYIPVDGFNPFSVKCLYCGKELIAEWKVRE